MARWLSLLLPLSIAGCLGPQGPELPPNVGATHTRSSRGGEREQAEPPPPAEPIEIGTPVWASFRGTGFYFHGVVVERRDLRHRVIYDDGAAEWVPASGILPDSLGPEAHVHVRPGYEGEFAEGEVTRRLGSALYVRFASGDEGWTTLPHVRFLPDDEGVPRRGDEPIATEPAEDQVGRMVLVNYHLQNLRFAGVATARRDDGRVHVVYLDGETEWVRPRLVAPEQLREGDVVHIRRRWDPPQWVRGTIQERLGDAFRVQLDDGGVAWTTLFRLREPVESSPSTPPSDSSEGAPGSEDATGSE